MSVFFCSVSLVVNDDELFCVRLSGAMIMASVNLVTNAPDDDVESDSY